MKQQSHSQFGAYLKQLREERGLSIRALADKAGLDSGALTRLEHSQRQPRPDTLQALAAALDMPLAGLFAMAGYTTPYDLPSMTPYLRARYGHLPEETLKEASDYLERLIEKHGLDPRGPLAFEDEQTHSSQR